VSALTVKIKQKKIGKVSIAGRRLLVIALDKSGSMSGSAIATAKEAIEGLVDVALQQGITDINFITYESWAVTTNLTGKTLTEMKSIIKAVQAGGGTDFPKAFQGTFNIVFLTLSHSNLRGKLFQITTIQNTRFSCVFNRRPRWS
jgi:uncharacterized protein with von Willebrand factor type A (vWA) domain